MTGVKVSVVDSKENAVIDTVPTAHGFSRNCLRAVQGAHSDGQEQTITAGAGRPR